MPLQDILLQVDSYPDPTPPSAIDEAARFAAAVGGKLSLLAVQVDIPLRSNALADRLIGLSALEQEWEAKSHAACRASLDHFTARAQAAGVFVDGRIEVANLYDAPELVARRARTRDLCIVPLADRYDGQTEVAQAAIFGSGRPVLCFRAGQPIVRKDQRPEVVIAWDGSRCAARAMADALPILREAASVRVVTFVDEKPAATSGLGAEAVRHLAAHGIAATHEDVASAGAPIGRSIDANLADRPADLLVMGAYGHPRWREFVLGGATEHVLRAPPTALLLSH